MEFDMALIMSPEDVVFIIKPYCMECADRKLGGIIKIFPITVQEVKLWMKEYKLRAVRIKCECNLNHLPIHTVSTSSISSVSNIPPNS